MPIPRDHRTIENPKLWTRDVLIGVVDRFPEGFNSRDVCSLFDISIQESCTRLNILKRYGCIKVVVKKQPRQFVITNWGHKMADRWRKKDDNL